MLLVLEATIGGTRRHLRDLAFGLSARGWTVHIAYAARREKDFLRDIDLFHEKDIACTEIDMERGPAPMSDLAAIVHLRRLIRDFQPDIIHLHSTKAGLLGRLAACGSKARVIYTPHCFAFEMESPLHGLYFLLEKMLIPLTDTVIAVCGNEENAARKLGYSAESVHCIHNGIPPTAMPPAPPITSLCFIGRNCRQKGVDLLLKAFQKLKGKIKNAQLTVMSDLDGALAAEFKNAGAITVPFGRPEDAISVLREGGILVMPSRWEAFPYTPLEAFASGIPVIAFDVGGVREAVHDHENGILVPKGDVDALASAMNEVLSNARLRTQLAHGAAASAGGFPLSKMLDETERLYRE